MQVSDQRLALVEREVQLRRLERTVAGLVARLTGSREELRDLRSQHGDLSREADITRDRSVETSFPLHCMNIASRLHHCIQVVS